MERVACGIIRKKRKMEILSEMPNYHYVWINNLSRLLSSQVSKCKISKYFCDRCVVYFHSEEKLKVHEVECETLNKSKIKLPSPKPNDTDNSYQILKFKNFKNKEKAPFVVYADFESVLLTIDNDVRKVNRHEPSAVGYFVMCRYDESKSCYRSHVGADSTHCLMMELKELAMVLMKL